MNVYLQPARLQHIDEVLAYVRAYHEYEDAHLPDEACKDAIAPLLGDSSLGRMWLICLDSKSIGYVAICFGYSIEFGGRDAFIDEMFITLEHRGKGHGRMALDLLKAEAARLGVRALHLEVARTNLRAQSLYRSVGFTARDKYFLMSTVSDRADVQQGAQAGPPPSSAAP